MDIHIRYWDENNHVQYKPSLAEMKVAIFFLVSAKVIQISMYESNVNKKIGR